jgi:hypothetical protein
MDYAATGEAGSSSTQLVSNEERYEQNTCLPSGSAAHMPLTE